MNDLDIGGARAALEARDNGIRTTERERIWRDLGPHIAYLRRVGYTLTAERIEKVVRGEVEQP